MRASKPAWALLATAVFVAAQGRVHAQDRPVMSDIRQETTDHSTRLIVECSGPVAYTYYSPDPLTLVVDIPEVDAAKVPARIEVGTKEVESVRVTTMARADGRSIARLEVRLANLVPYQIYSKDRKLNFVFERGSATAAGTTPDLKVTDLKPVEAKAPPRAPETKVAEAPKPEEAKVPEKRPAEPKTVEVVTPAPAPPSEVAPARAEPSTTIIAQGAPARSHGPATQISGLVETDEAGQLAITVKADGGLHYQDFFLGNPDRLVVDFKDVLSRSPIKNLEIGKGPVKRARLAQFSAAAPKVTRLVLDLNARAPYRIVEGSDGVKILFGDGGRAPSPAPLAALRPDPPADPAPVAVALAVSAALPAPAPAPILPAPADPQIGAPPTLGKDSFEAKTLGPGPKVYTGHPITLDFKDGDLQDIFRLFADISGLNVVVNPGVSGKVTLKLVDVPWDQALDLILKANGLGYTLEDNVIRIARLSDLQKEEQDRRKLEEEKALAGNLTTWRKSLSYSKAQDMSDTVRKVALSARGTITLDPRTNTMIITDLPTYIDKAKDLIADLDRATPQVEIEARIVVTSRNFTRDVGIQWGFLNQRTPQFGNTTGLTFPNSIIVNGQGAQNVGGLPADQGGLAPTAGIGTGSRGYAVNLPAASFNSAIGVSLGNILGSFNIDAALTALERQGRGRILSTPKVTTQNNQEASIKQGLQIPIQTTVNNTISVQFKDAVLTLKVTPQITDAGTVILNLEVENNSPDFANEVNGIPPINTQSAKTQVLVRDGSTAVIGGIYQSNEQTAQASTPFLSRIPILGLLFRERSVSTTNNELLLFITPHISKL